MRPLANLADLDSQKGPQELLTEAFGAEDGGRILENGQEAVEQVQRSIVVYRPDLSNPATS